MNTAAITPVLEPVKAPPGYVTNRAILTGGSRQVTVLALIAVAIVLPFVLGEYRLFQATQVLIFAVAILGLYQGRRLFSQELTEPLRQLLLYHIVARGGQGVWRPFRV